MAAGRPKEPIDLPEGWQNKIIFMYGKGASDVEVKGWIYSVRGSFSNDLWDRWIEEEPEFSETIKGGKIYSEAWWARQGRINLKNKEFSFTGWYMNMKNRFGWADKQEIDQKTTIKDERIDDSTLTDSDRDYLADLQLRLRRAKGQE
jgi:hypothetical protein